VKDLHAGFHHIASHRRKTLFTDLGSFAGGSEVHREDLKRALQVALGSPVALGSTGTQGGMRRCAGLGATFDAGIIVVVDRLRLTLSVYSK